MQQDKLTCSLPTGYTLRRLQPSDVTPAYFSLLSQLTLSPPLPSSLSVSSIFASAEFSAPYIIESPSSEIVASASLIFEQKLIRGGARCAHIEDVVVCSTQRGKGLGTTLVKILLGIALAEQNNCYKVVLDCKPELEGFYEKCGLKKRGSAMSVYREEFENG